MIDLDARAKRAYDQWRFRNWGPEYQGFSSDEAADLWTRMIATPWEKQTREIRAAWAERTHRDGK